MALPLQQSSSLSLQEYLQLSKAAEERYEYEHATIVAMGHSSLIHSELMLNTTTALRQATKGKGCKVYAETVSVEVEKDGLYYLPDVVLTCSQEDINQKEFLRHPELIVEILSPGSQERDRGIKLESYLKIPGIKYYLLISQEKIRVDLFAKNSSNRGWSYDYFESWEDVILLDQLEIELALRGIYEEVNFTPN